MTIGIPTIPSDINEVQRRKGARTISHSRSEAELGLVPRTLVSEQHSLLAPLQIAYINIKHFWKNTQEMNNSGYLWAGGDWRIEVRVGDFIFT